MRFPITRRTTWIIWLALAAPAPAADEPEVLVELARPRIYEGETVQYRVTLNHVQNPQAPKLEGFADFEVKSLGEQSLNSRQIININGRVTQIVRYGRAYDYELTPKRAGMLQIPAPVAEVDGKTLRGQALELEVVAPQDQDLALLDMTADRDSVYPLQPLTITLTVAVKNLPEPFADRNPLAVLRRLPALSIPWADDGSLPDGWQPETSWEDWLEPQQNPRGFGFSINRVGGRSVFSLFDDGPLAFLPKGKQVKRKDRAGKEASYWEFAFSRRFTPRKVGPCSFGPVTLKGVFVKAVDAAGQANTEDIYAIAKAVSITVKDVPTEGRPDSYINAIGTFTVDSTLAPPVARVGDPLTLTVTLRGQGTLDTAAAPDLQRRTAVTDLFRVYEATEETRDKTRVFTYSLRPLRAGEITFPALPLTYFDVEQEQYVTLQTKPIPLKVAKGEALSGSDIAVAAGDRGVPAAAVQVREDGILANVTDLGALRDQSVHPSRWLAFLVCLTAGYAGLVVVSRQVGRFFGDQNLQRRRAAPRRARHRLHAALAQIESPHIREGAEQLGASLVGLVADVAALPEAGLTSRDVDQQLAELGIDGPLRTRVAALLAACDAVRYGAAPQEVAHWRDTAPRLLDELVAAFKKARRL